MAKRLMLLMGMLALALTTAVPAAFAQEEQQQYGGEVAATGVLVEGLPADVGGVGTHSIEDEATGELYALRSAGADLASYEGQRVTVYGALAPGEEGSGEGEFGASGTLPSIDVTRVEPAGEGQPGPRIVEATGVLDEPYTPGPDPTPVYDLTDEATGTTYTLFDIGAGLDAYVGQRVTVEGTRSPGINPLALDVTSVVPAGPGGPPPGPVPGSSATFSYELAVECEPPANAEFLGFTATESLVTTPLTDPDGDGVYTGSQAVPRFAPGPTPPGTEPITISPVRIVQGPPTGYSAMGPEYRVIEDFGAVVAEDTTLSASVSFCDGGPEPVDPAKPAPVEPAPGGGKDDGKSGGSVVSGDTSNANKGGSGSGSTGGGAVVSGDTNDTDKGSSSVDADGSGSAGGSGNGSSDASASAFGDAAQGSSSPIAKVLPATGGVLPAASGVSVLLIVCGLVARKIFR